MKRILTLAFATVLVGATAFAAPGVTGTKHDLSSTGPSATYRATDTTQICVFCHTPHDAILSGGTPVPPLWNHTLSSTANYGRYTSPTMNGVTSDITNSPITTTNLCLSCHDGSIGVGSLANPPNDDATPPNLSNQAIAITGNSNLGSTATALANDHPVNFSYSAAVATADGGLLAPSSGTIVGWLVGGDTGTNNFQCSTCHQVHDNTNLPFLRATNTGSALCKTCHTNK